MKSIIKVIRDKYWSLYFAGLKFAQDFGVNTFVVPRIIDGKKITLKEHDSQVMEILEK